MPKPVASYAERTRDDRPRSAGGPDSTGSKLSVPLTTAGGAILVLGLVRSVAAGDAAMGAWLATALSALAGAGVVAKRRLGTAKELRLRHCALGGYAALALVVGISAIGDVRLAAALLGSGIVSTFAAAMLVAGMKGRSATPVGRDTIEHAPTKPAKPTGHIVQLASAKERGRWLIGQRPDDEVSVVYIPEREYAGTLDYDQSTRECGPFRAQVVAHEGRVTAVQVFVPGVVGGYIADLRTADGESGLVHPDRAGLTEGLGTNVPGCFGVASRQQAGGSA